MRIVFYLVILGGTFNVYGQNCSKYDKAIRAGDGFLRERKYEEAIVEFQAAQIAARECKREPDLVERFRKVFEGLARLKNEAVSNRLLAEKATALARSRLVSEEMEKSKVERLRDLAKSQAYANAAYVFCEKDPTIAMSFAFKSIEIQNNRMALIAMLKAFNLNSWFYNRSWNGFKDAALSPDGSSLAAITAEGVLEIEDLLASKKRRTQIEGDEVTFLPNGNILVWSKMKYGKPSGTVLLTTKKGQLISTHELKFLNLAIDEKGMVTIPILEADRKLVLHNLNPDNGTLVKMVVPDSYNSLSLVYATSSKFTILANDYPGDIWVKAKGAKGILVPAPQKWHITSVGIKGYKAVFYLRSSVRDDADCVGVFNLDGVNPGRKMTLYPLKETSSDAAGNVTFIDNNTIVATSTEGWSKIINLESKAVYSIEGLRSIDQIIPIERDSVFILARRSGEITIFDYKGIPVGNLQSTESSDGINYAFSKVAVDNSGKQILTVSRGNSRLWQKPRYSLKVAGSILDKEVKDDHLSYLTRFNLNESTDLAVIEADPLLATPTNNFGEIFLQFHLSGYIDLFKACLYTNVENPVGAEYEDDVVYTIFTNKSYKRRFVLKPDLVYRLIKKEFEDARILEMSNFLKSKWVDSE